MDQHRLDRFQVRSVTEEDAIKLLRLWRETWTSTYGPSLGSSVLETMLQVLGEGLSSMLPGTGERGYCCLAPDGDIVGSAIVVERGTTAYLWGMYVLPHYQRSGVGSCLLQAVAQNLVTAERLEVRALDSSPWAQAFYRARGFERLGPEMTAVTPGVSVPASVMVASVGTLPEWLGDLYPAVAL